MATENDKNVNLPENGEDGNEAEAKQTPKDNKNETEVKEGRVKRFFKNVKSKIDDGVDTVKQHPVVIGLATALGIGAGSYVTYKIMDRSMAPVETDFVQPPMIPENTEEQEEEEASTNPVEYVDIPE